MDHSKRDYEILIVEDEDSLRVSLSDMLEFAGFRVRTARNGAEGWQTVQSQHPDLILSDIMMPELDGYGLLRKIRSNEETSLIPMMMITAKVEVESKLHGLELGADDYITKPFEFKELRLRATNLLKTREKLLQAAYREPDKIKFSSQDVVFMKKLNFLLEEQMAKPSLSTQTIAEQMHMSLSTMSRKLRKITGQSPNQFTREYRLKRARDMVKLDYGTLSEIAHKTGFNSLSYFSRSYKDFFGHNPGSEKPKTH